MSVRDSFDSRSSMSWGECMLESTRLASLMGECDTTMAGGEYGRERGREGRVESAEGEVSEGEII